MATEIKRSGYATDPLYASKLIALIENNNMNRFDWLIRYRYWILFFIATSIFVGVVLYNQKTKYSRK